MSVTEFTTEQIHAQDAERITRTGDEGEKVLWAFRAERLPKYEDEKHE